VRTVESTRPCARIVPAQCCTSVLLGPPMPTRTPETSAPLGAKQQAMAGVGSGEPLARWDVLAWCEPQPANRGAIRRDMAKAVRGFTWVGRPDGVPGSGRR
jgi:hypothetical protein